MKQSKSIAAITRLTLASILPSVPNGEIPIKRKINCALLVKDDTIPYNFDPFRDFLSAGDLVIIGCKVVLMDGKLRMIGPQRQEDPEVQGWSRFIGLS